MQARKNIKHSDDHYYKFKQREFSSMERERESERELAGWQTIKFNIQGTCVHKIFTNTLRHVFIIRFHTEDIL